MSTPSETQSQLSDLESQISDQLAAAVDGFDPFVRRGRVIEAVGTLVKVSGLVARVGDLCELRLINGKVLAGEVIGFANKHVLLALMGQTEGIASNTEVVNTGRRPGVFVGDFLLGRVLNGLGSHYLDGDAEEVTGYARVSVEQDAPPPLSRKPVDTPLHLGVRCIDGFLTCGEGQRVGIFAPAGCGKSTLLSMLATNSSAQINVIALIGERGREVSEFLEHSLGPEALQRSVVVVATSDRPAMERIRAAQVATSIAEYFRDQGLSVLLLMDSVTRYARALREVGLSAGEPPTRRGFPPSVFSQLPRLLERAGQSSEGAITGFYTVLEETDDGMDPVSEEVRSLLDGHIVLSRKLAEAGHYPAIDILASTSRVMSRLVDDSHRRASVRARELWAKFQDLEILIQVGEYRQGEDANADMAVAIYPELKVFLKQEVDERAEFETTVNDLRDLAQVS